MPIIQVKRASVTPHVRKTPTSTCAAILAMTPERINKELPSEGEKPTKVESLQEAFAEFAPKIIFQGSVSAEKVAGDKKAEFEAHLEFHSLKDFDPENILKHQGVKDKDGVIQYRRNDLADLGNTIEMLYRLRKTFDENSVRRAWSNPEQRKEIVDLIGKLQQEVSRLSNKGAN